MTTMVTVSFRVPHQSHSGVIGRSRKEFQVAVFVRVQFQESFAPTGNMDVNTEVETGASSNISATAPATNAQLGWGSNNDGNVMAKACKEASRDTSFVTASKFKTNDDNDNYSVKATIVHSHE